MGRGYRRAEFLSLARCFVGERRLSGEQVPRLAMASSSCWLLITSWSGELQSADRSIEFGVTRTEGFAYELAAPWSWT